jgi:hypothetical protein
MSKRLKQLLLASTAALSLVTPAAAREEAPIVWVDKSRSLAGARIVDVMPVTDETGASIPPERLVEIRKAIQDVLDASGSAAAASTLAPGSIGLRLQTILTSFKTGDPAGRWVGFGAGAAKCTIRARLLELDSSRVVADIISTRIVDSGGFFTVGVDTRIHQDLAHDIGKAVAKVLASGGSSP